MPSTFVDYVRMKTGTIGTGALTLGDAVLGFRGADALLGGNTYSYNLTQPTGEFELGRGIFTKSSSLLTRGPTSSSEPNNAPVSLTGLAIVTITILAGDLVFSGLTIPGYSANVSNSVQLIQGYNGLANTIASALECLLPPSAADGDLVEVQDEGPYDGGAFPASDALPFNVSNGDTTLYSIIVGGGNVRLRYSGLRAAWLQLP